MSAWDQIHTDFYQAQVIWDGPSQLPEDQFVTTWMFRNDNVLDRNGMLDAVDTAVSNFFGNPGGANPDGITDWMPSLLGSPRLKIFDMGETPPRVPEERVLTSLAASDTGLALPREVALCCSYNVGGPGPRNRGRTYLGPFTVAALAGGTPALSRPHADLTARIAERAEDLATNPSLECTWVLWSRRNAEMHTITGGFVDNAWDTIRKRGKAPESRVSWGAPIVSGVGGDPGGDASDLAA